MRVFIAGASGVIGRPLVGALRRSGHDVTGMTRHDPRITDLEALGATAVVGDALDRPSLMRLVEKARPDAVVNQLTSIPPRINPRRIIREFAQTNRLRREGTQNLMAAALAAGAKVFVAQSIAFAYTPGSAELRTESDPLFLQAPEAYAELIRAVASLEQTVLTESRLTGIVLRYGFFYGPGTVYASSGSFTEDVRRRAVPVIGGGNGVFSFVHVDDAATATVLALEQQRAGVYNVVDSDPAPVHEWLPEFARMNGARRPFRVPRFIGRLGGGAYGLYMMTAMAGASNQKARLELQWTPRYTSWREGMRAELGVEAGDRGR